MPNCALNCAESPAALVLVHLKKRDKRACKKKSPLESVSKRLNFLVRPTRIELVAYSLGVHTASVVWDNVC